MPVKTILILFSVAIASPVWGAEVILVTPFQRKGEAVKNFEPWVVSHSNQLVLTDDTMEPDFAIGDLVKKLRETQGPVDLVCFHRAAADCLSALLIYPSLQKKVGTFVSLEGKVRGLEEAEGLILPQPDSLQKASLMPIMGSLRFIFAYLKEYLFPRNPGLYAMTPTQRLKYLTSHRNQIKKMSQSVRLISIDTSDAKYGVIPFSHQIELSQNEKIQNL